MRSKGNRDGSRVRKLLTSNDAIAEAVKIAKPDVIAAYPITPQSPIVERLAKMIEDGELNSSFIRVESEHSEWLLFTVQPLQEQEFSQQHRVTVLHICSRCAGGLLALAFRL